MLKVIIHNDDIGLTHGFSDAIFDCYSHGLTTSTSLRTNGTAYSYTIKYILPKMKGIGLGLHVNLTDGQAYSKELADYKGNYKRQFIGYISEVFTNKKLLDYIKKDIETQFIQTILKDKLKIDHVNGHDHIHMIPPIFEIVAQLCEKFGIKYLRVTNEDYYLTSNLQKDIKPIVNANILKFTILKLFSLQDYHYLAKFNLKTTERFYGVLHTGDMSLLAVKGALKDALEKKYSLVEILSHPVYQSDKDVKYTSKFIMDYANKGSRLIEAQALKNPDLKKYVKKNNISLINFKKLS